MVRTLTSPDTTPGQRPCQGTKPDRLVPAPLGQTWRHHRGRTVPPILGTHVRIWACHTTEQEIPPQMRHPNTIRFQSTTACYPCPSNKSTGHLATSLPPYVSSRPGPSHSGARLPGCHKPAPSGRNRDSSDSSTSYVTRAAFNPSPICHTSATAHTDDNTPFQEALRHSSYKD